MRHLPLSLLLALALLFPALAAAQPDQRCFAETNQCIAGPIRAYWERGGGLPVFGFPITAQGVELGELLARLAAPCVGGRSREGFALPETPSYLFTTGCLQRSYGATLAQIA